MRISERSTALAARTAYLGVCMLLTVFYLYLPFAGYERMMEEKYACFLILAACVLIAAAFVLPLRPPRFDAMRACAAAYLGCSAVSALFSPFGAKTLLGGTRSDGLLTLAIYTALFFFFARYLRPDRRLLHLAALSVSLCCLLALAQTAGLNPFRLYPGNLGYHDGDIAYAGFFAGSSGNVDFTAFLLALALCALLAAMLRERLWSLAPAAALTLITLLRLHVSLSLLGLCFALLWSPALLFPKHTRALLLLSLALSLLALAAVYLLPWKSGALWEASQLLHGRPDDAFGSGRVGIWHACLPLVKERPLLGGGPDTLWLRGMEPFAWHTNGRVIPSDITAAHNEYLNILVNQGALALVSYVSLLVLALVRCFRRAENTRFAVCGAALLCVCAMSAFSVSTCITAPYVWLLLALVQE